MTYQEMHPGVFLRRPNRFIAHIEIHGKEEICHVKNTGRCRELLTPGAKVYCEKAASPLRKTQYDLIAVEKGSRLINMDSQAPNKAAGEWLAAGGLGKIENLRPETPFGDSRIDFSFQKKGKPCLLEVKGVTLEEDGVCSFPDAPTLRGGKALKGAVPGSKRRIPCLRALCDSDGGCRLPSPPLGAGPGLLPGPGGS